MATHLRKETTMSDMIPRGMSKMMRKAAPKRKHGAAKISKKTKEKIRPKEDVGKFIAKKSEVLGRKGRTIPKACTWQSLRDSPYTGV